MRRISGLFGVIVLLVVGSSYQQFFSLFLTTNHGVSPDNMMLLRPHGVVSTQDDPLAEIPGGGADSLKDHIYEPPPRSPNKPGTVQQPQVYSTTDTTSRPLHWKPPFYFSACLAVRDNNRLLPEWLAYHYTVLPLRRIIVHPDPASVTQPHRVLQAYANATRLNYTVWKADDFMTNGHYKTGKLSNESNDIDRHQAFRYRQAAFMTECTKQLKREKQSWVLLIDSDEFLTFNAFDIHEGVPPKCGRPMFTNVTVRQNCFQEYQTRIRTRDHPRGLLPDVVGSHTTVAHMLDELQRRQVPEWYTRYCIVIPRIAISSHIVENNSIIPIVESPGASALHSSSFETQFFRTFSFLHHGMKQNTKLPGKSIVDVSRYDPSGRPIRNPHRVLRDECQSGTHPQYDESLFRVEHYSGSLKEWGRAVDKFWSRNNFTIVGRRNETSLTWLSDFSRMVGYSEAYNLTQGLRLLQEEEGTY